jgi:beta-glucanase (GH16 family)
MHKYGYYEIRCKLPKQPGWWAAFWLQSPTIGSTLDPADLMEKATGKRPSTADYLAHLQSRYL